MALLMSGSGPSLLELRSYESSILDVASREGIDLTEKGTQAREQIASEILTFLMRSVSGKERLASRPDIGTVVVTAEVRRWHILRILELTYRDANSSQINERYKGKLEESRLAAKAAGHAAFRTGIGIAAEPITQAETPTLTVTSGTAAAATYYVRASWTRAGEEGEPSELTAVQAPDESGLTVAAAAAPESVTGWYVYVGNSESTLALQNDTPLAVGIAWTMPESGLQGGRAPGSGQTPDYYVTDSQRLQRG